MKRTRLAVVALLTIVFPSLSQAADAKPLRPGADIIGGVTAQPGEFPFMAAILDERLGGTDYNKQFCGGSLIASAWVLTAAHCVEDASAGSLAVAVGRTLLSGSPSQGVRRSVAAVRVHPDYDPVELTHDAALLQLSSPVDVNTYRPIQLATTANDNLERAPTVLTVIGWGTTSARKANYPNDLRKVDVPVVEDGPCAGAYGASLDAATMVCAGAPNIDSCYGDSGGPLFDKTSRIQVGIVSWGNGCAKRKFPGVYSEINNGSIRSWITTNAGV